MSSRLGRAPNMMAFVASCLLAHGVMSLPGCTPTPLGATDADLARAHDQAAQGAAVYSQECARCHGQRGEGLAGASAVLGSGALPEYPRDNSGTATITDPQQLQIQTQTRPAGAPWRDPFRNAQDVYDFVSTHLPKSRASEMKQEDYWAVVTFLIAVQGGQVPPGDVNPTNAKSVPIPRR
jgi:mono/diheme cytochrome c family protein